MTAFVDSDPPDDCHGRAGGSRFRASTVHHRAALACIVVGWSIATILAPRAAAGPSADPTPPVVVPEPARVAGIDLPSPAGSFGSFDEVTAAVAADRRRVAELEARLHALEQQAQPPPEPLPTPLPDPPPSETAAPPAGWPDTTGVDGPLGPNWADGLEAESWRRDFRVKIGGRTQVDASAFTAGSGPQQLPQQGGLDPSLSDAVNLRRARLRIEGRMHEVYDWACEYEFANQINVDNQVYPTQPDAGPLTAITDLWLQMRELPVLGIVRVGNQKDPYGYEHLTSSRWLNFMERSYSQDAFEAPFNNGFVPGIQVLNSTADGRFGWQVGEFKNTANPFGFSNFGGGSMTVGRLVYLPTFEDEGRRLLHLGLSGRTMAPQNNQVRFRSRGDIRNGPPGPLNSIYADSGLLQGTWQNMIGLELVGNNGPWSFQSEYFGSWLCNAVTTDLGPLATNGIQPAPGTPVGTVYYQGGYAEVLYFLTGESRTYSRLEYRFDRPIPRSNFFAIRGRRPGAPWQISEGAWQVGARYNYLCLSDGTVNGGVLNGLTIGLNWLLNPNARVYFNYDFTYRDFVSTPYAKDSNGTVVATQSYDGSGGINGFGMRLAFDF